MTFGMALIMGHIIISWYNLIKEQYEIHIKNHKAAPG